MAARRWWFVPLLLAAAAARAEWPADGVPVCAAPGDQRVPVAIADGAGGAIVVWEDRRTGEGDLYAQRIGANGVIRWAAGGVPLCTAAGEQFLPVLVPDGAGGAIVIWEDARAGFLDTGIYAQRIDADGAPRWDSAGVAVCTAAGAQHRPAAVADGAGGAIVAWYDGRGADLDVYAQRLDGDGAASWAANGVAVAAAAGDQTHPALVADGAGGAVAAWSDTRVRVQRLDAAGVARWAAGGVEVATTAGLQLLPAVVADGAGGAIVAWTDTRRPAEQDLWAQRLSEAGARLWGDSGAEVCAADGFQLQPFAIADGSGGAIVAWRDFRGADADLYVQRLDAAGAPRWSAGGAAVCVEAGDQFNPALAARAAGGVVVAWHDFRAAASDLFAGAVEGGGVQPWTAGGLSLCGAAGDQTSPVAVADGAGGALVIWDDARNGLDADIFATRIDGSGGLVPAEFALVSASARLDRVTLRWHAGAPPAPVRIERRTAEEPWRAIAELWPDGTGGFELEDRAVRPGRRYGYRALLPAGPSAETWIEVPARPALSLEAPRPQPARGPFTLALALADGRPARLEIHDVAGRRRLARDLGSLGAGRHLVPVREDLAPGLYVVRLIQGGATATVRLVVRR